MTRHTDGRAQVERANRMARAVELRGQGHTIREIADAMRCSASSAHALVTEAIAQIPAESVAELRAIEGDRLDQLHNALRPRIESGDPAAVGVAVKVSARRSALLGLDAPVRVEVEPMLVRMDASMIPEGIRPRGATGWLTINMATGQLVDPPPPELAPGPWDFDPPGIVEADDD